MSSNQNTKELIKTQLLSGINPDSAIYKIMEKKINALFYYLDIIKTNHPRVTKERKANLMANAHRYDIKLTTKLEQVTLNLNPDLDEEPNAKISEPIIPPEEPTTTQGGGV